MSVSSEGHIPTKVKIGFLIMALAALAVSVISPGMLILFHYKPAFFLNAGLAKVLFLAACLTVPFFCLNLYLVVAFICQGKDELYKELNPEEMLVAVAFADEFYVLLSSIITYIVLLPCIFLAYLLSLRFSILSALVCSSQAVVVALFVFLFWCIGIVKKNETSAENSCETPDGPVCPKML